MAVPQPTGEGWDPRAADAALADAVRALGRREYAIRELGRTLADRGHGEEAVASAIATLVEEGMLDDRRFARRFAEDKRSLAGWGEERIRGALEGRGIDAHDVERALAVEDAEQQLVRATALAAERLPSPCGDADRRRVLGALVRRGHPLELAYEAIRRAERDQGADG